jgi:hypothetical protein
VGWRFVRLVALVAAAFAQFAYGASAAEVSVYKDSKVRYSIVIEGVIEPGDFEKVYDALKENGPLATRMFLFSPGGDVEEAIKIAELIRELKLETRIPLPQGTIDRALNTIKYAESCSDLHAPRNIENCVCASACTILWVAGVRREFGLLRVHRPKLSDQFFANLDPSEAERAYNEMSERVDSVLRFYGFPDEGIQKMKSVPSYRNEEYKPHGVPTIVPYFDELLTARCSSSINQGEFSLLRIKKLENRASAEELRRLTDLEETAGEVESCRTLETFFIHWSSFSDYFGIDYAAKARSGELYEEYGQ